MPNPSPEIGGLPYRPYYPTISAEDRKNGGPDRDQTDDLIVANDALYQLSYWPKKEGEEWEKPCGK